MRTFSGISRSKYSRLASRAALILFVWSSVHAFSMTAGAQSTGLFTASQDVGTPSTIGPGSTATTIRRRRPTPSPAAARTCGPRRIISITSGKRCRATSRWQRRSSSRRRSRRPARRIRTARRASSSGRRWTPDSVYADAAVHGDGLTSLQWRDEKGGVTHEVQSSVVGPSALRIEKRGNYVSMSVAGAGEELRPAGGAARVEFTGRVLHRARVSRAQHRPDRDGDVLRRGAWRRRRRCHRSEADAASTPWRRSACARRIAGSSTSSRSRAASRRRTGFPTPRTRCTSTPAASCTRSRPTCRDTPANPNRLKIPEPVDLGYPDAHQQRPRRHARRQDVGDQRSVADGQRPAAVADLHRAGRRRARRSG